MTPGLCFPQTICLTVPCFVLLLACWKFMVCTLVVIASHLCELATPHRVTCVLKMSALPDLDGGKGYRWLLWLLEKLTGVHPPPPPPTPLGLEGVVGTSILGNLPVYTRQVLGRVSYCCQWFLLLPVANEVLASKHFFFLPLKSSG